MAIKAQIRQYIAYNLLFSDNIFDYEDDVSFIQTGIIDSVGVLELVAFVKETFGVDVPDREVIPKNFDSVNKLAKYIDRKIAAGEKKTLNKNMSMGNSLSA